MNKCRFCGKEFEQNGLHILKDICEDCLEEDLDSNYLHMREDSYKIERNNTGDSKFRCPICGTITDIFIGHQKYYTCKACKAILFYSLPSLYIKMKTKKEQILVEKMFKFLWFINRVYRNIENRDKNFALCDEMKELIYDCQRNGIMNGVNSIDQFRMWKT